MSKEVKTYNCSRVINDCYYSNRISGGGTVICDYLYKTGERRGCDPKKCDKYIHRNAGKKTKKKKETEE